MKSFKLLLTLLAMIILGSVVFAQASTEKSTKKTQLQIVHWNNLGDDVIAKFEQENPDIEVLFEKFTVDQFMQVMKTRVASGEIPDIIGAQENDFPVFLKNGIYKDITDYDFVKRLTLNAQKELIAFGDGRIYAIPSNAWAMGIFINVDMFKQHGIKIPENYQDLHTAAQAFRQKGIAPFVQGIKDSWTVNQMFIPQFRLQVDTPQYYDNVKTGTAKWTDPEMVKAYQEWYDLFAAKGMMFEGSLGITYEQAYQLFAQGRVPMWPMGTWAAELFKDDAGKPVKLSFEMDFIPQFGNDTGEEVINAATNIGAMYSISSSTKKLDAAIRFLDWLTTRENAEFFAQKTGLLFPIQGVDFSEVVPYGNKLIPATFEVKVLNPFDVFVDPAVKQQLTVMNQNLLAGIGTVKSELEKVQKAQEIANLERK